MKKNKKKAIEEALQYVRDNKTWSDAEDEVAVEYINRYRCGISQAAPQISDEIYELMNEWSADSEMDEDWWLEITDEDEIFWEL